MTTATTRHPLARPTGKNLIKQSIYKGFALFSSFVLLLAFTVGTIRYNFSFASASASAYDTSQFDIWWPSPNSAVNGVQPFKAMLKDHNVGDYQMFWQVDNGQWTSMYNSNQDYPHKEAMVDVSNWNWKGNGPYDVTFIAMDNNGNVFNKKDVNLSIQRTASAQVVPSQVQVTQLPTAVVVPNPTLTVSATTTAPAVPVSNGNSSTPLSSYTLYINPNSTAKQTADSWRSSRPADAALMDKLAKGAESDWIGNWNADVQSDVRNYVSTVKATGAVPVFISYNIPQRDCGGYSAGGSDSPDGYKAWIQQFANGIGNNRAVVILEPDATSLMDCLSAQDKQTRFDLLTYAVNTFKALGNTFVYIDAGHPNWIGAADMAARLQSSGIAKADGFALNVSNFNTTQENIDYGNQISPLIGGKHFIIDTSRNGQGAAGSEWCNPAGRGLGVLPTTNTGVNLVDAYMWLKKPGESDGNCNGGPSAGVWFPDYALGLAQKASW